MRRREFITLIGGAAGWPLAARAQAKLPTMGTISPSAEGLRLVALVQRLRELGWIEDRNVAIAVRWAEGRPERYSEIAAEFIRLKVDVVVTGGTQSVLALKQATSIIPIVFATVADPVGIGLVASLARPGGNLTGVNFFSAELVAKRLDTLHELVPKAARVAVFINPSDAARAEVLRTDVHAAARAIGLELQILNPGTSRETESARAQCATKATSGHASCCTA
jgi:putative ABC transport system substrate-binding protein